MTATRWVGAIAVGTLVISHSQAQVVWNNGGFATGPVTRSNGAGGAGVAAPAGTRWSELVDGNGSGGSANYLFTGPHFRIADDFTLTANTTLTDVRVYAYSTGAAAAQAFTTGNLQIWSGRPGDAGSTVVFGDATTNRVTGSTFTNVYRTPSTTNAHGGTAIAPATNRPVQEVTLNAPVSLPAGTYWIDYQVTPIVGFATAFTPYVTFADNATRGAPGANGRQLQAGQAGPAWADVVDIGDPPTLPDVVQEFPFLVDGTPVPEPGSLALAGLAGLAGCGWRRWTTKSRHHARNEKTPPGLADGGRSRV
jgi:hypothetical protein